MSQRRALNITCTVAPGNSATVIPLDSTYGLIYGSQASQNASTGAGLTPGRFRNKWAKAVVRYSIHTTTQDVTVLDQILTGVAGTSADWETQGSSHTVTAGTTLVVSYTPSLADWRIRVDAGGTQPATCVVRVSATWDAS